MTTKLAYQVSYTTEYRDGRVETHDPHTKFFATRQQAVAHARSLTGASENNGVFVSDWLPNWLISFLHDDESDLVQDLRITAIVETVILDEIEATL